VEVVKGNASLEVELAVRPNGLIYMSVKLPHAGLDVIPLAASE